MLLYHKPGATSFDDLKTVDCVVQPTFQAACSKLGLLDDDTEIDKAMDEAATVKFGNQLRDVFANILIWIHPTDCLRFYNQHKSDLRDDYRDMSEEDAENELLIYLQERLGRSGLELKKDFKLPTPKAAEKRVHVPSELREEYDFDIPTLQQIDIDNYGRLSDEQRHVYNTVMVSVYNSSGLIISLDACGGSGKKHLSFPQFSRTCVQEERLHSRRQQAALQQLCYLMDVHCTRD